MNPQEMDAVRKRLGLNVSEFAKLMRKSRISIHNMLAGRTKISGTNALAIELLDKAHKNRGVDG